MSGALVGPTPRKLPEQLHYPRAARPALVGRMPIVCMLCGDHYKDTPCVPAMDGKTSHGLCAACTPVYEQQIETFFANRLEREGLNERRGPEASVPGHAGIHAARKSRENHEPSGRNAAAPEAPKKEELS